MTTRSRAWLYLSLLCVFPVLLSSIVARRPQAAHPGSVAEPSRAATHDATGNAKQRLATAYGKLPLAFEVNQGQTAAPVKFLSRGSGYSLFLTPTEAVLSLQKDAGGRMKNEKGVQGKSSSFKAPAVLHMKLLGANPCPRVSGLDKQPGISNYFIGNDPHKWRTNVSHYAKVKYQQVYPGVDLVYYGNQRQLEYDFVVAPGADPSTIELGFSGARQVEVNPQGELLLDTGSGKVIQHAPIIYQTIHGQRRTIEGRYALIRDPRSAIG